MIFEGDPRAATAAFLGLAGTEVVDEDVAHDATGKLEELKPAHPRGFGLSHQFEVGLVDQCRRCESASGSLAPHVALRELLELRVDALGELIERFLAALAPFLEELRDVSSLAVQPGKDTIPPPTRPGYDALST